jgi:hypothetical protein
MLVTQADKANVAVPWHLWRNVLHLVFSYLPVYGNQYLDVKTLHQACVLME